MAVDMRERSMLGCSYYVAEEEKLYLLEDVKLGSVEIISMRWLNQLGSFHRQQEAHSSLVKILVNPTVILVSNGTDDDLMHCLDHDSQAQDHGSSSTANTEDGPQYVCPTLTQSR